MRWHWICDGVEIVTQLSVTQRESRSDYAAFSRRADSELSQPTLRTWVGFANFLESPYKDSWLMATVSAVRVTGNRPS
jgi:hypothetical protein